MFNDFSQYENWDGLQGPPPPEYPSLEEYGYRQLEAYDNVGDRNVVVGLWFLDESTFSQKTTDEIINTIADTLSGVGEFFTPTDALGAIAEVIGPFDNAAAAAKWWKSHKHQWIDGGVTYDEYEDAWEVWWIPT